jgi:hypothetical protein
MPNEKAPRKCCPGPGSPFLAGIDRGHCKDEKQVSGHISCLNPPALGGTITVSSKPVPILRTLGLQLQVLYASSERDFKLVFARLVELRASGLVIGTDSLFNTRKEELAALRSTVRQSL